MVEGIIKEGKFPLDCPFSEEYFVSAIFLRHLENDFNKESSSFIMSYFCWLVKSENPLL